jgi:hypothetical protein
VSFSDSRATLAAFVAAPEQFDVVVSDEVIRGAPDRVRAEVPL